MAPTLLLPRSILGRGDGERALGPAAAAVDLLDDDDGSVVLLETGDTDDEERGKRLACKAVVKDNRSGLACPVNAITTCSEQSATCRIASTGICILALYLTDTRWLLRNCLLLMLIVTRVVRLRLRTTEVEVRNQMKMNDIFSLMSRTRSCTRVWPFENRASVNSHIERTIMVKKLRSVF